jgi:hypothetical protein
MIVGKFFLDHQCAFPPRFFNRNQYILIITGLSLLKILQIDMLCIHIEAIWKSGYSFRFRENRS